MREVVLRAIAKKITWVQAADVLGISYPAMERLRRLFKRRGYDGHWVRASHKPASPQVPLATVERVLLLYQEKYSRLDVRAFHQKLRKTHHISLSYRWLEQALHEAGLVAERSSHVGASEAVQTPAKRP
jgi:transposase